jgi:hypothetical protein
MTSLFLSQSAKSKALSILCVVLSATVWGLSVKAAPKGRERRSVGNVSACRELNLFNTGIDATGGLLADGKSDPHYELISVPNTSTSQTRVRRDAKGWPLYPNGPYIQDNGISSWIGPNNDVSLNGPAGKYTNETTFSINEKGVSVIEGKWSSDNDGVEILLNGEKVSGATSYEQFRSFVPFRITSGFRQGVNQLQFVVNNGGAPTALRVELNCSLSAAVSSPAKTSSDLLKLP